MVLRILSSVLLLVSLSFGGTIYVSSSGGDDKGDGTIKNPLASLWRAIEIAGDGDTIYVAGGKYCGENGSGRWKIQRNIAIIGGVEDKTFKPSKCGQWCNATILYGNNDSLADSRIPVISIEGTNNVLIRALIIDGSFRNNYDENGCLVSDDSASAIIDCETDGDVRIDGCVLFNSGGAGIEVRTEKGTAEITNCVIFNCVGAGISLYAEKSSARFAINDNQILLTWKKGTGGFGLNVDSPGEIEIGFNYIAYSQSPAINVARWNENVSLRYNKFLSNRGGEYRFVNESGGKELLKAKDVCTRKIFDNCEGNEYKQPKITVPAIAARGARAGCIAPKMKIEITPMKIKFDIENEKFFQNIRRRRIRHR
ncbi:right-handed parallel beta-helix repeat-containing protein [bacterium]|nr:right-handed parallel beta-helix repeat-containing protein [bacterium]